MADENKKFALAINIPVDCVSKTDCYYLCNSFVNFGGISEDKANLEELAADLDTVETGDLMNNDSSSTNSSLRRLIVSTSIDLFFTNDETISYTPDSDENTEGFDVLVLDDPKDVEFPP